jgi:hypothetical protein
MYTSLQAGQVCIVSFPKAFGATNVNFVVYTIAYQINAAASG